jgi:cytochrome c2
MKEKICDGILEKLYLPISDAISAQMRSADEGQTVFNECKGCGHNWAENS